MEKKDLKKCIAELEYAFHIICNVSEKLSSVTELTIAEHRGFVKNLIDIQHAVLCVEGVVRCALPSCEDCANYPECPEAKKNEK